MHWTAHASNIYQVMPASCFFFLCINPMHTHICINLFIFFWVEDELWLFVSTSCRFYTPADFPCCSGSFPKTRCQWFSWLSSLASIHWHSCSQKSFLVEARFKIPYTTLKLCLYIPSSIKMKSTIIQLQ